MHIARSIAVVCLLLLTATLSGQQVPPGQGSQSQPPTKNASTLTPPTRDAQAVTVANQVITAAGGATAINAIKDFTATGNMALPSGQQSVQVPVTINGMGLSQFRIDTTVTSGVSSWAMYHGKVSLQNADGSVVQSYTRSPLSPSTLIFPHQLLATAINSQFYSLLYEGVTQIGGHSAIDIRIQPTLPSGTDPSGQFAGLSAVDFVIDASTFQILATRDMVRTVKNMWIGNPHEIQYTKYTVIDQVSIPFSISESLGGQTPRILTVQSFSVNSGLTDADFQLQPTTK
jgi:hypothetical protein